MHNTKGKEEEIVTEGEVLSIDEVVSQQPKKKTIFKLRKNLPSELTKRKNWFTINNITYIDYKDTKTLKRFTNRRGLIVSSALSRLPRKIHRIVTTKIKQAQEMGFMPYIIVDQEI